MNTTSTGSNKTAPKVRLFSKDVERILRETRVERCKTRLPAEIYNTFKQIEEVIKMFRNHPENLDMNVQDTIGLPQNVIDELDCKLFELCEMIDHADDDNYTHHLSRGSLYNVGMSAIRRCFYVAVQLNPTITQEQNLRPDGKENPCPYPYAEIDGNLLDYLENLFLRIYKFKLTKQMIPLYAMGCLQICCYTRYAGFNCEYPMDNVNA